MFVPRQHRSQIESKAIHMHLGDPVSKTVADHPADHGKAAVERVAGAGVMKLEVIVIPVSDVDGTKDFYARLGWRLDADVRDKTPA